MEKLDKVEKLIVTLNHQALKVYKEGNIEAATVHLDQALHVLDNNKQIKNSELYWMTYNNYGIALKKQKQYTKAVKCFILASEKCGKKSGRQADCYLHLCSLFSKLMSHENALQFALKAVNELKSQENAKIIVAYQNAGVEYEHLGLKKKSMKMYEKGCVCSLALQGKDSENYLSLKERYEKLKEACKELSLSPLRKSKKKFFPLKKKTYRSPDLFFEPNLIPDFISAPISNDAVTPETGSSQGKNSNKRISRTPGARRFYRIDFKKEGTEENRLRGNKSANKIKQRSHAGIANNYHLPRVYEKSC